MLKASDFYHVNIFMFNLENHKVMQDSLILKGNVSKKLKINLQKAGQRTSVDQTIGQIWSIASEQGSPLAQRFLLNIWTTSHTHKKQTRPKQVVVFSRGSVWEEGPHRHKSYVGEKRIITSPSPVWAAPPTSLSAYDPEPIIGESPTRLATSGGTHNKVREGERATEWVREREGGGGGGGGRNITRGRERRQRKREENSQI